MEKGRSVTEKLYAETIMDEVGLAFYGISLRSCMNYLIQFFYITDKRYSCTRTKIGKLLSILAFKYACKGIELFDETIYRYPNCGTMIKDLAYMVTIDVYTRDLMAKDSKIMIPMDEWNGNAYIPVVYQNVEGILPSIKADIEELFYNFGAYSHVDLSEFLNPIVEAYGVCRADGSINLKVIAHLDKNRFHNNKVVEYIFK